MKKLLLLFVFSLVSLVVLVGCQLPGITPVPTNPATQPSTEELSKEFSTTYDEAGSIGKRYRREDEIGTPYCITVDFETENDNSVTIRDRDTMEQVRVKIDDLEKWIDEKLEF